MTIYKLSLLFKLLDIDISRPNKGSENPNYSTEAAHIGSDLLLAVFTQIREEYMHDYRQDNHQGGDINKAMVKPSNQC